MIYVVFFVNLRLIYNNINNINNNNDNNNNSNHHHHHNNNNNNDDDNNYNYNYNNNNDKVESSGINDVKDLRISTLQTKIR